MTRITDRVIAALLLVLSLLLCWGMMYNKTAAWVYFGVGIALLLLVWGPRQHPLSWIQMALLWPIYVIAVGGLGLLDENRQKSLLEVAREKPKGH